MPQQATAAPPVPCALSGTCSDSCTGPTGRIQYRRDVLRHEANVAFASSSAKAGNYRKGEEVLLDALLLSRCDFLLHAASGVAEVAMYWNPSLHQHSVHLQYRRKRQRPPWFTPLHRGVQSAQ